MSKITHTPGPWRAMWTGEGEEIMWLIARDGRATGRGTVLAELETIDAIDREIGFWQTKANAILMASAPELLEALKKTVSVLEGMNYYDDEIAAAEEFRSVIARAEGEASS